jgi:hypothetical protein
MTPEEMVALDAADEGTAACELPIGAALMLGVPERAIDGAA